MRKFNREEFNEDAERLLSFMEKSAQTVSETVDDIYSENIPDITPSLSEVSKKNENIRRGIVEIRDILKKEGKTPVR